MNKKEREQLIRTLFRDEIHIKLEFESGTIFDLKAKMQKEEREKFFTDIFNLLINYEQFDKRIANEFLDAISPEDADRIGLPQIKF